MSNTILRLLPLYHHDRCLEPSKYDLRQSIVLINSSVQFILIISMAYTYWDPQTSYADRVTSSRSEMPKRAGVRACRVWCTVGHRYYACHRGERMAADERYTFLPMVRQTYKGTRIITSLGGCTFLVRFFFGINIICHISFCIYAAFYLLDI